MMANLYLVCTLLDMVFALGDFNSTFFVSGGGPAMSTEVLATLGIRYAFTLALPRLGVAAVMSALPLLIPLVILLMRKLASCRRASYERDHCRSGRHPHPQAALPAAALSGSRRLCLLLGFVLVVWSLTPIYNMWLIALRRATQAYSAGRSGRRRRRWRAFRVVVPRTSGTSSASGISSATASSSACR